MGKRRGGKGRKKKQSEVESSSPKAVDIAVETPKIVIKKESKNQKETEAQSEAASQKSQPPESEGVIFQSTPDPKLINQVPFQSLYDSLIVGDLSPIQRNLDDIDDGSILLSPNTGPSFKTSTPMSTAKQGSSTQEDRPVYEGLTTPVKNTPGVNVRAGFSTPERQTHPAPRGTPSDLDSGIVFNSPIFVTVRFDSSNEEEEQEDEEGEEEEEDFDEETADSSRYKLRPRKQLFPQGVTLHRYTDDLEDPMAEENNVVSDCEDDDMVYLMDDVDLVDSDYDDDEEEEDDYGRRGTYGSRGPKADAKALSLINNCPTSVKWLVENFEYHPGKSLPRGFVYDQYIILCGENGLDPLNAASFGKLIRSVFPGLKTRRLGTRGNSKYHYNGVYLKGVSPLLHIMNLMRTQEGLMYDNNGKRGRRVRKAVEAGKQAPKVLGAEVAANNYLGKKPELDGLMAELNVDFGDLPILLEAEAISVFENLYNEHCKALIAAFANFDLKEVFDEWRRFWRVKLDDVKVSTKSSYSGLDYNESMSKTILFKVCSLKATTEFMNLMDLITYQHIIDILFPGMNKAMPAHMAQALKNLMKQAMPFLLNVLTGYPKAVKEVKFACFQTFITMWMDYSKLNRMVGPVEQTLHFEDSIQAMRSELLRAIDFDILIRELGSFTSEPMWNLMTHLLINFKANLQDADQSVEGWIQWTEALVDRLVNGEHQLFPSSCLSKLNRLWKSASDSMLGAVVKGNAAATVGVFKILVTWCDSLIAHVVNLETSRCQGFTMQIFYYASSVTTTKEAEADIPDGTPPTLMAITYPERNSRRGQSSQSNRPQTTRRLRSFGQLKDDLQAEKQQQQQSQVQQVNQSPEWDAQVESTTLEMASSNNLSGQQTTQHHIVLNEGTLNMNNIILGFENATMSGQTAPDEEGYSENVLVIDPDMFSEAQLLGFLQDNSNFINFQSNENETNGTA